MSGSQEAGIVVGVDGTAASIAALVFALREGARRECKVEVVTAWAFEGPYDGQLTQDLIDQARTNAERTQDKAVTAALMMVTAPPLLARAVVEGAAGPELIRAADEAEYLVVGRGQKNVAQRALLGSVSRYCVQHASIPVLVVPEGADSGQEQGATPPATTAVVTV